MDTVYNNLNEQVKDIIKTFKTLAPEDPRRHYLAGQMSVCLETMRELEKNRICHPHVDDKDTIICDECGTYWSSEDWALYRYCPYCGREICGG